MKDKPACPMEAAPSVYSLEEQEGFFPRQEDSKEEGKREGAAAMFPNKSGTRSLITSVSVNCPVLCAWVAMDNARSRTSRSPRLLPTSLC